MAQKTTTLLKFTVQTAMLDALKADADASHMALNTYLVGVLAARDRPVAHKQSAADAKAERLAKLAASRRAYILKIMAEGASRAGYVSFLGELSPADRADCLAIWDTVAAEQSYTK
jgi:hypothetical protein